MGLSSFRVPQDFEPRFFEVQGGFSATPRNEAIAAVLFPVWTTRWTGGYALLAIFALAIVRLSD